MDKGCETVVLVIPALNEAEALPHVLKQIPEEWVDIILVVDNGSTDSTSTVAQRCGAVVVQQPQRGYGAAMWRGLQEIDARWPDTSVVVFLDGDASDSPQKVAELVSPILKDKADFVLGSRLLGEREPGALHWHSGWGNRFACLWLRFLTGQKFTDLGPFRAIRWPMLKRLQMEDRDFGWTIEMQIKAAQAGMTIREIPVPYKRRIGTSKISGTIIGSCKASYKILLTLIRYTLSTRTAKIDVLPPKSTSPSRSEAAKVA